MKPVRFMKIEASRTQNISGFRKSQFPPPTRRTLRAPTPVTAMGPLPAQTLGIMHHHLQYSCIKKPLSVKAEFLILECTQQHPTPHIRVVVVAF